MKPQTNTAERITPVLSPNSSREVALQQAAAAEMRMRDAQHAFLASGRDDEAERLLDDTEQAAALTKWQALDDIRRLERQERMRRLGIWLGSLLGR